MRTLRRDQMDEVPFFANTADDTHCVQACFRIMLKYFIPERDFSYEELDRMSQKQAGKGTWWPPMLMEVQKLGLRVKCIEGFDYKVFYREGEAYVRSIYPKEPAEYYLKHSNLMKIRDSIPAFLQKVDVAAQPAKLEDLDNLLENGWLVGIDLDATILNDLQRDDYLGHMVVIFRADNDQFWLHDPGLKPHKNRQVSRQKLNDAWFSSGRENAGLVAVKKSE